MKEERIESIFTPILRCKRCLSHLLVSRKTYLCPICEKKEKNSERDLTEGDI